MRLQLDAESYGIEFNEHYLRNNGERDRDGGGLRGRGRARRARGGRVRARRRRSRARRTWRELGSRSAEGGRARRAAPTRRRWSERRRHAVARGRDRRPSRRLLRELRRALPLGRGEGPAGRLDAGTGSEYTGPTLSLSLNRGAGTPIGLAAADDERQHRSGHHAGHLHRASRAGPDRRGGQHRARRGRRGSAIGSSAGAVGRGGRETCGSAAGCRRWAPAS